MKKQTKAECRCRDPRCSYLAAAAANPTTQSDEPFTDLLARSAVDLLLGADYSPTTDEVT